MTKGTQRHKAPRRAEVPEGRDAGAFLRAAANDASISDNEFSDIAYQMWRSGTLPNGLAHILSLSDGEMLRETLREPLTKTAPNAVCVPSADEDNVKPEESDEPIGCPLCSQRECGEHLLACFDLTFPGQGNHGAGLGAGALYEHPGLFALFDALHGAKLEHWGRGAGHAEPPPWIARQPALRAYFDALGDDGFSPDPGEEKDDAVCRLAGATVDRPTRVRDLLEALCTDCGWDGITTHDYDDVPMASSAYSLWWDNEPKERAQALQVVLRGILADVASTPTRPTSEGHVTTVEPRSSPAAGAAPAPSAPQAKADAGPRSCCPVCQRPEEDCLDHLLAFHLFPRGGTGLEAGFLSEVEEIEDLLGAVRLAWIRSVRGKEVPIPVPPAWIWEERALRDYFYQLGPLRELDLDDDEPDEDATDRLRDLPWDHSALVRDFLLALLPECGWEGLAAEIPSEPDEETGIECLGSMSWWSADPDGVTERLRAKLVTMLAKAEPVAGRA